MKGLVPIADPAHTREDLPEVKAVGSLADQGVGVVIPRQEAHANVAMFYPTDRENIDHLIRIPRHSAAKALDKTEQSVYESVGKPPQRQRPHYRRAFTVNTNTLSIDQSPIDGRGKAGKVVYDKVMAVARGFQMALADGVNIEVPSSAPAGSDKVVPGFSPVTITDLYAR